MARADRLLAMIGILRARRMPVTAKDLSEALGISQRSAYRDIDTLRGLGAPVIGEAGVGYRLGKGFFLPEFAFSADELDALALGLGWVQQRADPALARSSESALAKVLAARSSASATNDGAPVLAPAASASRQADPVEAALLRDAIRRQRKARIRYRDGAGVISERVVWPIAIVYFDDVRILAAWCEQRSAFRHFRIDRLQAATTLEERYPGRRQAILVRWRQQDRDWRSLLPDSDKARG